MHRQMQTRGDEHDMRLAGRPELWGAKKNEGSTGSTKKNIGISGSWIFASLHQGTEITSLWHGILLSWNVLSVESWLHPQLYLPEPKKRTNIGARWNQCIHMSHMRAMSCSGHKSLSPAQSAGCQYSIWLSILVLFGTCHCSVIARNTRCPAGKALKRRWPVIKIDQTHESTSNRHRRTWQAGDLRPGKFLGIHGANWCKLVQHMGGHRTLVHLAGGATDSIARQALGRE